MQVDFPKLCARVDDGFMSWRKPSMLLFGSDDPFIDLGTAFEFLDSKRTNMKISTVPARVRASRGPMHACTRVVGRAC